MCHQPALALSRPAHALLFRRRLHTLTRGVHRDHLLSRYRAEIAELRSQVRQKDEKASAASKRYKDTVKRLSTTNEELRAEVAALEQARLDEWAKRTTAPSAAQQVESRPATAPASPPAAAPSSLQMDQARARGSLPTVSWKDYSQGLASTAPREEVLSHPDGKVEKIGSDGRREVAFPNGTRKEVSPDGFVVVRFFNGDIKRTFPNQKVGLPWNLLASPASCWACAIVRVCEHAPLTHPSCRPRMPP